MTAFLGAWNDKTLSGLHTMARFGAAGLAPTGPIAAGDQVLEPEGGCAESAPSASNYPMCGTAKSNDYLWLDKACTGVKIKLSEGHAVETTSRHEPNRKVEPDPELVSQSSVAALAESDSGELTSTADAVRRCATASPKDLAFRQLINSHSETLSKNTTLLATLAAYAEMEDDTRVRVIEWIDLMVTPATEVWPCSSYSIKGDLEQAVGTYVTNEQFKGAMLVCGYVPVAASVYGLNWRFHIKPAAPQHLRPPHGSLERGSGGFGLDATLFGKVRDLRRTLRQIGFYEAIQTSAEDCGEAGSST